MDANARAEREMRRFYDTAKRLAAVNLYPISLAIEFVIAAVTRGDLPELLDAMKRHHEAFKGKGKGKTPTRKGLNASKLATTSLSMKRRIGEWVYVGDNITVTVVEIRESGVKLRFEAPEHVAIRRPEMVKGWAKGGPALGCKPVGPDASRPYPEVVGEREGE